MSILTIGNDDGTTEISFQYHPPRTWTIPAGYSVKMDGYPSDRAEIVRSKGSPWSGEGLSPVGSTVRIVDIGLKVWPEAQKFFDADCTLCAVFMTGDTQMVAVEHQVDKVCCCFRADMVRTPEQIAAEERDQEITEISSLLGHFETSQQQAERLYLAGYRKQVKP